MDRRPEIYNLRDQPDQLSLSGSLGREVYPSRRDRYYRLNAAERDVLESIGKFRAIEANDLDIKAVQRLEKEGLVKVWTVYPEQPKANNLKALACPLRVVGLTADAKELLEDQRDLDNLQRYYSGFVKPQELAHDCAGYRAYLDEKKQIEAAGGRVERVVLDFELKSHINSALNRAEENEQQRVREGLAKDLKLPLVNGKIPLPDVQVVFIDRHGQEREANIEVITRHYKGAHRAGKVASGFKLVNMHLKAAPNGPRTKVDIYD